MKTVKLYDENSHLFEFSATVISCEKCKNGYLTVLDRTAFFPEGGGQHGDSGTIDGIRVTDTQVKDGVIYHTAEMPLQVGKSVECTLDKDRRFAFMQNHSGEHIVSGIVHKKYGYDNVGFHLEEDFVTLDFNGILDRSQLDEIELIANKKVWQNVKFHTYYPTADELKKLDYRSKKELEGDIRIVEIENTDICACCAPHVNSAGEIGIIKLLETEKMRGGTRIVMKCGAFALNDYQNKFYNIQDISVRLSAKSECVSEAVAKLEEKFDAQKLEISALKKKIIQQIIKSATCDDKALFADGFGKDEIQTLADSLHKTFGGVRAVFSKTDNFYAFAMCGDEDELNELFAKFKSSFAVRGGGRGGMVAGSVEADEQDLKKFF